MESIDLISFLHNYYGINSEYLYLNVLTHQDVKILFPNIIRKDFQYLNENRELLYSGKLILVHDSKGNIAPYVKPDKKELCENGPYGEIIEEAGDITYQIKREKIIVDEEMLKQLSKDELLKLRSNLKRTRQHGEERKVVKAIRKKKDYKVMNYKRKKNELKNGGYYD